MKAIVCGGRNYEDAKMVDFVLQLLGQVEIIEGGARGADQLARGWAEFQGIKHTTFHADWKGLGRSAGPERNRRMLAAGADLVVSFPGGSGTRHMVNIARKAGVPVLEVAA